MLQRTNRNEWVMCEQTSKISQTKHIGSKLNAFQTRCKDLCFVFCVRVYLSFVNLLRHNFNARSCASHQYYSLLEQHFLLMSCGVNSSVTTTLVFFSGVLGSRDLFSGVLRSRIFLLVGDRLGDRLWMRDFSRNGTWSQNDTSLETHTQTHKRRCFIHVKKDKKHYTYTAQALIVTSGSTFSLHNPCPHETCHSTSHHLHLCET